MDKNNEKRFEKRQPNSDTREELLVIMNYLQNYAYDKKHATTQTEITDYALNNYGINIRRDRVGSILIHLEQISRQNPDLLPFRIESISLNKIKKYYVPQKLMNDDDIAKICSIIIGDKHLSVKETERLLKAFTSVNTTRSQMQKLNKKINVRLGKRRKVSDANYDTYDSFNRLCEYHDKMPFRLKDPFVAEYSKRLDINILESFKGVTEGYPAFTYDINGYTKYIIYVKKYKLGIITTIDNLEIIQDNSSIFDFNLEDNVKFELDIEGEDKSLEKWVDAHYKGVDGYIRTFKLKITSRIEGEEELESFVEFKEKFKEYWSKPLVYTLVKEPVEYDKVDEKGNPEKETVFVYDAIFEVKSNTSSFRNWYLNEKNFDKVTILDPADLNDVYLGGKVERYINRLNKYGRHYNYTITKELKPEYEEVLKRYHEQRRKVYTAKGPIDKESK